MKYLAALAVLVLGVALSIVYFHTRTLQSEGVAAETYVREHISELSPEKEVLGGTFFVTKIELDAKQKTGYVEYEDGHVFYAADFTYVVRGNEEVSITSFSVRGN